MLSDADLDAIREQLAAIRSPEGGVPVNPVDVEWTWAVINAEGRPVFWPITSNVYTDRASAEEEMRQWADDWADAESGEHVGLVVRLATAWEPVEAGESDVV